MKVSPARRAAFEILRRVETEGAYSSVLLAALNEELSGNDRALCHELVLGVLRRRLWLDRAIEHFAARKIEKLDLPVVLALRLGLYQLRFLSRIPASAAVNESVNIVRASRVKSGASFVNAVLRQSTREPDFDPAADMADRVEKLAIETSHPRWLFERWSSQWDERRAAELARANNEAAPLTFRFTAKASAATGHAPAKIIDELRAAGVELLESKIAPGAYRVSRFRIARGSDLVNKAGAPHTTMPMLRRFAHDGLIYFQDEASQLVAQLLGDGERLLDVCAAPGSKSTLVAALLPGSTIVAGDLYEHRVQTIKELAKQQAAKLQALVHDATRSLPFSDGSFDRVLVDAPCSGTGTLRHNPEIRWRLQALDIAELAAKQKRILANAAAMVRPGGLLLYSTCSVETDENEAVVSDFLNSHREFETEAIDAPSGLLTKEGVVRTWPHRDDVDGFFVAALRRRA